MPRSQDRRTAGHLGGTAGAQFDPCYHLACDTLDNVSLKALDVNSDAIAFAVLTYAYSTESVNGVPGRNVPGPHVTGPPPDPKAPAPAVADRAPVRSSPDAQALLVATGPARGAPRHDQKDQPR